MSTLDDLRFPIGRFAAPAGLTPEQRASRIQSLRQLPENLKKAVEDLSGGQLDTPYREGGWSLRQVVHHLADSHANGYTRFKLALTEEWPTIKPYSQAAWAELADSKQLPVELSLAILDGLHTRWAVVLESMTEEDFQKGFLHPDQGKVSLTTALATYEWHGRHHLAHITGLRARKGW